MVHRLLGVACGAYTPTSALVDMKAVEVCLFFPIKTVSSLLFLKIYPTIYHAL